MVAGGEGDDDGDGDDDGGDVVIPEGDEGDGGIFVAAEFVECSPVDGWNVAAMLTALCAAIPAYHPVWSGPGRSRPVQAGPGWSRPVQTDPGRSRLFQAGPGRSRLVQYGPGWSWLVQYGPG